MSMISKTLGAAIFAGANMVLMSALSFSAKADPGDPPPVLIVNNTIYSGLDGHKLRGDHVDLAWTSNALKPATWTQKTDILFNWRRLDANKPTNQGGRANTDASVWAANDSCINMAARAGQYVELLYGGVQGNGSAHQLEFWKIAAARYKNRTHVLFALQNEPIWGWVSSRDTTTNYGCPYITRTVRSLAPNSLIFPASSLDGADSRNMSAYRGFDASYLALFKVKYDWSYSAFAFHGYDWPPITMVDSIKNKWPCVEDEVPDLTYGTDPNFCQIDTLERKGVAWNVYYGKQPWDATTMKNNATSGGYAWWINPKLVISAKSLSIAATAGAANPASAIVRTVNDGAGTLTQATTSIAYQEGSNWLTIQNSGSGNLQTLTNSVSSSGMAVGVYHATVTVTASNSVPATKSYTVILTVSNATKVQNQTRATEIRGVCRLANALVTGGPFGTEIQIANAQGRIVRAEMFSGVKQVSLAGLKPGIYVASVRTQQGMQTMAFNR
jgi:hypothetical protein